VEREILLIHCELWIFSSKLKKTDEFGMATKFGKNSEKVRKLGFPNVRIFQKFRKLYFSEHSENYKKMTLNSNFGNREKLVPARKPTQKFG